MKNLFRIECFVVVCLKCDSSDWKGNRCQSSSRCELFGTKQGHNFARCVRGRRYLRENYIDNVYLFKAHCSKILYTMAPSAIKLSQKNVYFELNSHSTYSLILYQQHLTHSLLRTYNCSINRVVQGQVRPDFVNCFLTYSTAK